MRMDLGGRFTKSGVAIAMVIVSFGLLGMKGGARSGVFIDSPVSGLTYQTTLHNQTVVAQTTEDGVFNYDDGATVSFSVGTLVLGSAVGKSVLTPLDIVAGAADSTDRRVTNILVLLQTLDQDANLNNGIQITQAIADIVSAAGAINFNQTPSAFAADSNVVALLAALNGANVFTDADPRPRTIRNVLAAQEHFARSTSKRIVVETKSGKVKGYLAGETWQFLGIPYAKAPLGDLRWKQPQPVERWKGERGAIAWSDQCPQDPRLQRFGEGGLSEDCLYLHVTAPKDAHKLPVMVWFHGGGYTALTSNTKAYNNPEGPASKDVVLVTVNHRLGVFGYLAHPELSAESGYGGSGNYGNMDLIAALQWVQRNIKHFGGDPRNVTIFGESGGGRKVLSLRSTPLAAGLFHKAISQSGSLRPDTRSLAAAEAMGSALTTRLGVTTLAEMRAKSWLDVFAAAATTVPDPYPNVDNYYFPDTERNIIESGRQNDTPFMIMVTNDDNPEPIGTVKNYLPWMADHTRSNVYACLFTKAPSGWESQGVKAYHAAELTYLFNAPFSVTAHYQLGLVLIAGTTTRLPIGDLNGNGVSGSAGDAADILTSAGFNAVDHGTAQTMMTLWTNFAKTGNPSTVDFMWPAYTSVNDTYVDLGAAPVVKTGLSAVFP